MARKYQNIQRNIQYYYGKVRHSMFYLEGIPGGSDMENEVKEYKKNN